jgi:hypothetical protein
VKIAATVAVALLSASTFAFAADNSGGGKNGNDADHTTTSSLKGNGLNIDGTSDDATKCRDGTAGAALCRQRNKNTAVQ